MQVVRPTAKLAPIAASLPSSALEDEHFQSQTVFVHFAPEADVSWLASDKHLWPPRGGAISKILVDLRRVCWGLARSLSTHNNWQKVLSCG